MFFPPLKWALDVFDIHFITFENQKLSISLLVHFCQLSSQRIQIVVLFKPLINNTLFRFNQKMQMIVTFNKQRKQKKLSHSSTMALPCSQLISENTRQKVLNLGCNIKKNISLDFFLYISLRRKEKNPKPQQLFF